VRTFLEKASEDFEVVVFTAALPIYANAALDFIDPMGELIRHRLFRESCVQSHGYAFVKDLSRLGRDMSRIVLVMPCLRPKTANDERVLHTAKYTEVPYISLIISGGQ